MKKPSGVVSNIIPVPLAPLTGASAGWTPYSGTWSSSDKHADVTLSRINSINTAHSANSGRNARGTVALTGKVAWHYFVIAVGTTTSVAFGIANVSEALVNVGGAGGSSNSYGVFCQDGKLYFNGSGSVLFGTSFTTNDYITVAYDNGNVWFAKNGVYPLSGDPTTGANPHITGLTNGIWYPYGVSIDRNESVQLIPAQI